MNEKEATTEEEQKQPKYRARVCRYPGILTDWGGRQLRYDIRDHLRVGNIVRVPVSVRVETTKEGGSPTQDKNHREISQVFYLRIIKHCDGHKFRGRVEDPYYGCDPMCVLHDGDERVFSSRDVMEIPLTWKGNENLDKVATFIPDKGRAITGALMV